MLEPEAVVAASCFCSFLTRARAGAGGGAGGGASRRQLRGGAALPRLPERAPPLAPPAREPGRGGRGQEAASAPGSAAAGVGGQQPRSRRRERLLPERAAETKGYDHLLRP
ncbi:hypothetical protein R6Z07F_006823 [Ovis aries]